MTSNFLPPESINLVRRTDWDADMAEGDMPPLKLPVTNVFFTYTNTEQCSMSSNTLPSCYEVVKRIQQESMYEYNMPDIPYNFLLGGDGSVYEGRGWRLKPEPIPDEPELNERDTLVVAYIGKKEDSWPKYRKKLLERTETDFLRYCVESRNVSRNADIYYDKEPSKMFTVEALQKKEEERWAQKNKRNAAAEEDEDFDDLAFDDDVDDFENEDGVDEEESHGDDLGGVDDGFDAFNELDDDDDAVIE